MTTDVPKNRLRRAIPWLWLATSLVWAIVIIVTDQLAWPLALWIATTVGPLTYLTNSQNRSKTDGSEPKGSRE